MILRKRHTPEQVIPKLRQAEADLATGLSIGQVGQKLGLSEQTSRAVVHQPWQSPGQCGAPPDAEIIFLAVIDVVLAPKLFERLDLFGEPLNVVVDGDRSRVIVHC